MTKAQVETIRPGTEDLFLGDDVNLDLSQFPWLNKALPDESFEDEKFSQIANDRPGSLRNSLTRFVNENSTDPEITGTLRAAGIVDEGAPHKFFLGDGTEATVYIGRDGKWRVTANLESGQQSVKLSSATSRDGAMFGAESYFGKQRGPKIHALSKDEELYVARLAGRGKLEEAVMNYMAYAVPDFHGTDISSDPKYLEVCNACAWFVFVHSTPQFQDSDEARVFMTRYIGDRPITVQLLQFAFAEYKKTKEKEERGLLLNQVENRNEPPTVTAQDLNDLPDEEIDTLFHDVTRESLRSKIRR